MTTTTGTGPGPAGADRTQLAASLRTLRLSGRLDSLENRLAQAADGQLGFLDFLQACAWMRSIAATPQLVRSGI